MAHITNAHIVPAAINGQTLDAGNFWTTNDTKYGPTGHLPSRLAAILRARSAHIAQVIYSYSTPIAWLDNGVWIVPNVTYSATTSSKHQSQLRWARNLPWDAGMDEYLQVIAGATKYVPNPRNQSVGTYVAA